MSEPIPEAVPTSHDPRSKRPLKKRALSPTSATAANITALFAKPEQALQLANTSSSSSAVGPYVAPPPEIVANVQGSSAGAGSGEFHVYKASRRREFARIKAMEEEVVREKDEEEYDRERREREERDRDATERKRRKREMRRKGKGGKGDGEKVGGMKPRVEVGKREGAEEGGSAVGGVSVAPALEAAQEQGLIIHDDD